MGSRNHKTALVVALSVLLLPMLSAFAAAEPAAGAQDQESEEILSTAAPTDPLPEVVLELAPAGPRWPVIYTVCAALHPDGQQHVLLGGRSLGTLSPLLEADTRTAGAGCHPSPACNADCESGCCIGLCVGDPPIVPPNCLQCLPPRPGHDPPDPRS